MVRRRLTMNEAMKTVSTTREATPAGSSHASGSAGKPGSPTVRLATYPAAVVAARKNPNHHPHRTRRYIAAAHSTPASKLATNSHPLYEASSNASGASIPCMRPVRRMVTMPTHVAFALEFIFIPLIPLLSPGTPHSIARAGRGHRSHAMVCGDIRTYSPPFHGLWTEVAALGMLGHQDSWHASSVTGLPERSGAILFGWGAGVLSASSSFQSS